MGTVTDRFWSKVLRSDGDACWPWTKATMRNGYGVFQVGHGVGTVLAHRFAYELTHGPIPGRLQIDHLCHTRDRDVCPGGPTCRHRRCCNPRHLQPVTQKINLERGNGVGAQNSRKDTCPQGHPYDWIYIRPDQWSDRRCSRCYGGPYGNYVLI